MFKSKTIFAFYLFQYYYVTFSALFYNLPEIIELFLILFTVFLVLIAFYKMVVFPFYTVYENVYHKLKKKKKKETNKPCVENFNVLKSELLTYKNNSFEQVQMLQ